MRTTKPIATIAFNTPDFLEVKLAELLNAGRISFWAFIEHKPEDDEGGKKYHCHLYIEPSKMLQTDDIRAELKEFDPEHPDKPRGCITFKSSKFDPWYMYALHDKRYLASKGQSRRFHYVHDDIRTSDPDDLLCKARSIDMISLSPYADMLDAQAHGLTFAEFFARGTIPIQQVGMWQRSWDLLIQVNTDRADREGHPMDADPTWCGGTHSEWSELYESATVDPDTGEVTTPPAWYEVHPLDEYRPLSPDEGLPW